MILHVYLFKTGVVGPQSIQLGDSAMQDVILCLHSLQWRAACGVHSDAHMAGWQTADAHLPPTGKDSGGPIV